MKNNKWNEKDINFLKENYKEKSNLYITKKLNRSLDSIVAKAKRLKLKKDKYEKFCNIDELKETIITCNSYKDVCDKLNKTKGGATYKILKRIIKQYNIDITHFNPFNRDSDRVKYGIGYPIEYWLKKGTNISSDKLKKKLYKEGLKEKICEKCGQDEYWNGEYMALILDHINGINNDNRLENLRIVCPNCNSTLETHCRGYKKNKNADIV